MLTRADIPEYEGIYQITPTGEIYSLIANKKKDTEISRNGYERVTFWKNGKSKHFSVHRLVALAFIPNPHNYRMVNHIDGNKLNNNVNNLEWCDASANMKHAYEHNLIHCKTTRVIQYSKDFELIKVWDSITEACKELGINHANLIEVCKQKKNRKYAGGFIWRYADA